MAQGADPHDWNTLDHYRTINDRRIEEHPFVDHNRPNTLRFTEERGGLSLRGEVYCLRGVVLTEENWLEIRYSGQLPRVRTYSFRYAAWVPGGNAVLRYHNRHRGDSSYHHRVFDPQTGRRIFYERLQRREFPTLSEVLDEIEIVAGMLVE